MSSSSSAGIFICVLTGILTVVVIAVVIISMQPVAPEKTRPHRALAAEVPVIVDVSNGTVTVIGGYSLNFQLNISWDSVYADTSSTEYIELISLIRASVLESLTHEYGISPNNYADFDVQISLRDSTPAGRKRETANDITKLDVYRTIGGPLAVEVHISIKTTGNAATTLMAQATKTELVSLSVLLNSSLIVNGQITLTSFDSEISVDHCNSSSILCANGAACENTVSSFKCQCMSGYTGQLCNQDFNECSSNPCIKGTCEDALNGYVCTCQAGYTATLCDADIDECTSNPCINLTCQNEINHYHCICNDSTCINECDSIPCVNGGTCNDDVNGYNCTCTAGFSGSHCEEDINECDSTPCGNGGTCKDDVNGYNCTCTAGFSGTHCEQDINECDSTPCGNGGTCNDDVNGYNCTCTAGFSGTHCERDINECDSTPCGNGGTCNDDVNGYNCTCTAGFSGTHCDQDINECDSTPCGNGGTCNDDVNGYNCTCTAGFSGTHCDQDINECDSTPCGNGGTCNDDVNGYNCTCTAGFSGTHCDQDINECDSTPCGNGGTCNDDVNGYNCTCTAGFSGTHCEQDINECDSTPCGNGGTCNDDVNGYNCTCTAGFSGTHCEQDINECDSTPCGNGGTCNDDVNGYNCTCTGGFSGKHCEEIDECNSTPCINGGTCSDGANEYSCACIDGFNGTHCEQDINECDSTPCVNGTCNEGINEYNCSCIAGFTGLDCNIDINECDSSPCDPNASCLDRISAYICSCNPGFTGDAETRCEIVYEYSINNIAGTEFVTAFINHQHVELTSPDAYTITILNNNGFGTTVSITSNYSGFTDIITNVAAKSLKTIPIIYLNYQNHITTNHLIEPRGILITSDRDISVLADSAGTLGWSSDSYFVLPTQYCGTDYIAVTSTVDVANPNEILIVAIQPDTDVTVGQPISQSFTLMNIGDAVSITRMVGLTGTKVVSSNPTAVISGTGMTQGSSMERDHMETMLRPTDMWSKEFAIVPFAGSINSTIIITAVYNNSEVYFNGNLLKALNSGDWHEVTVAENGILTSTYPVQVVQFGKRDILNWETVFVNRESAAPFMTESMAVDQMVSGTHVFAPQGFSEHNFNKYTHVVRVVTNYTSIDSKVLLDEKAIVTSEWTQIGTSSFYFVDKMISQWRSHTIASLGPADRYAASVYGYSSTSAYGYSVTVGFIDISPCHSSPCDDNAKCTGIANSGFSCKCRNGYQGDGIACIDIDECADVSTCPVTNSECQNVPGSYSCMCSDGYVGDPIDACYTAEIANSAGFQFAFSFINNVEFYTDVSGPLSLSVTIINSHADRDSVVVISSIWPGFKTLIKKVFRDSQETYAIEFPGYTYNYANSTILEETGIQITSVVPVVVIANSDNSRNSGGTGDSFYVHPVPILSNRYIISTSSERVLLSHQAAITATEPNTIVRVGNPFFRTYFLEKQYQVLKINDGKTLSGCLIEASSPVAVTSGTTLTDAYNENDASTSSPDHEEEMLLPVQFWQTYFPLIPFYGETTSSYQIVASEDGTELSLNDIYLVSLSAWEYYELDIAAASTLCSSKPVQVMQFGRRNGSPPEADRTGGPSMAQVIGEGLFLSTTTTIVRKENVDFDSFETLDYMQIIAPSAYQSSISVTGVAQSLNWFHLDASCNSTDFYYADLLLDAQGMVKVNSSDPEGRFSVRVYGQGHLYGYAYAAGFGYEDHNECSDGMADCDPGAVCFNSLHSYNCSCESHGFYGNGRGVTCENIDQCHIASHNSCHEHATCSYHNGSYECKCNAGFEHLPSYSNTEGLGQLGCWDIDECNLTSPCPQHSTCVNSIGSYNCICKNGYRFNGTHCLSGATYPCRCCCCENNNNSTACSHEYYYKKCRATNTPPPFWAHDTPPYVYEGRLVICDCTLTNSAAWRVEQDCFPDVCGSGSSCSAHVSATQCNCQAGYTGSDCSERINYCTSSSCLNGGTCFNNFDGFECICDFGWSGENCEESNQCASNPCHNGATCIDHIGAYKCNCPPEYYGRNCQFEINECEAWPSYVPSLVAAFNPDSLCQHQASCVDRLGGFECVCQSGFNGTKCDEDINECISDPCEHGGTCTDAINGYNCACNLGFTGGSCETTLTLCGSKICYNGGTCNEDIECDCLPGFKGQTCESDFEECTNMSPCGNNATCNETFGSYTCTCLPGFTGDGINCEDIDECASDPCWYTGRCVDEINQYRCVCPEYAFGDNCEYVDRPAVRCWCCCCDHLRLGAMNESSCAGDQWHQYCTNTYTQYVESPDWQLKQLWPCDCKKNNVFLNQAYCDSIESDCYP